MQRPQASKHPASGDRAAAREAREQQRWALERRKLKREEQEEQLKAALEAVDAPIRDAAKRPGIVTLFGGGETGNKAADMILESYQMAREAISPFYATPADDTPSESGPDQPESGQTVPIPEPAEPEPTPI
jgi:hypothetical protein